jgi:hypothetical protein
VLFYADLAPLRASPFIMRLAALMPPATQARDYTEFVRATGFVYERDLDRVVLAIQSDGKNPVTTAIAEGRFDRNKIAAYALRSGKLEKQNGKDIYVILAKSPDKSLVIRFLNDHRISLTSQAASGPNPGPKNAPENRAPAATEAPSTAASVDGRSSPFPAEMQERLARLSGAPIFAVAKLDAAMQNKNFLIEGLRSDELENLARSIRWLNLAARPEGDRLRLALEGECDTAENSRQLAGALDSLLRIMGKMALSDPKTRRQMDPATLAVLEALLGSAEVSRDDKNHVHRVRLSLALTQTMLAQPPK